MSSPFDRLFLSTLFLFALLPSTHAAVDASVTAETIVAAIVEPSFPDRDFDIAAFGAVGDGETNDLPALQEAIDVCSEAGGGRVLVPDGIYYLRGPVVLKSHVNLHLSEGARLRFSAIPEDFLPPVLMRWEGTLAYGHSPFIYAYHATHIALTGKGVVDGNAAETFGQWRPRQKEDQRNLREMGGRGVPVHNRVFGGGHWLRPSLFMAYGCTNVLIEGPTFVDSPFWVIHPVFSRHVVVRDILVDSLRLNNDGVDPDSCSYVLIEDSTFRTGDDAVAIKSGRDRDGRFIGVPSENIVVRNCFLERVHNGVAIGSEMSGGVRNVFVENCRVGEGRNLLYFKSNLDRGGVIENVIVRNITVDTASVSLVRFMTNYHSWRGDIFPPTFKNFLVEDVTCRRASNLGIWAEGHEESPLQNVVLRNIVIEEAKRPLRVRPGDDVKLEYVIINGRPVTLDDSEQIAGDGGGGN